MEQLLFHLWDCIRDIALFNASGTRDVSVQSLLLPCDVFLFSFLLSFHICFCATPRAPRCRATSHRGGCAQGHTRSILYRDRGMKSCALVDSLQYFLLCVSRANDLYLFVVFLLIPMVYPCVCRACVGEYRGCDRGLFECLYPARTRSAHLHARSCLFSLVARRGVLLQCHRMP